jgi:hypothetical protein
MVWYRTHSLVSVGLVATVGLAAVKVSVHARIRLVQQVGLVRTGSVLSWARKVRALASQTVLAVVAMCSGTSEASSSVVTESFSLRSIAISTNTVRVNARVDLVSQAGVVRTSGVRTICVAAGQTSASVSTCVGTRVARVCVASET